MKLIVLDHTGHTTVTDNVEAEFYALIKSGYAAFVNDLQITKFPGSEAVGDILMIPAIAGG